MSRFKVLGLLSGLLCLSGCLEQGILLNKPAGAPAPLPPAAQQPASLPQAPAEPSPGSVVLTAPPTPSPSAVATPTPAPTGLPPVAASATPVPQLRLILSPSRFQLAHRGDKALFSVQIVGEDPAFTTSDERPLDWQIDHPEGFRLSIHARSCEVEALSGAGFATLSVAFADDPDSRVTADISLSAGGGSSSGMTTPSATPPPPPTPTPTPAALTLPVIDSANFAYAGSADGRLSAYDDSDVMLWQFNADGAIQQHPAARSGPAAPRIYFGTQSGSFYGLGFSEGGRSNGGGDVWQVNVGAPVTTAPLVSEADNLVVFGDQTGQLHAYSLDGEARWQLSPGGSAALTASPVMVGDHRILVATPAGSLCEVSAAGVAGSCSTLNAGALAQPAALNVDPAVFDSRFVAVGSQDGRLYVEEMRFGGGLQHVDNRDLGAPIANPATVSNNDVIYQPLGDKLYALDAASHLADLTDWPQPVTVCPGSRIIGAPVMAERDETLYIYLSCSNGRLYQVNGLTGDLIASWSINGTGDRLLDGPNLYAGPDGAGTRLRIGGADGRMQSFAAEGQVLHGSLDSELFMWPLFRHDRYLSGFYPLDVPE